MPIRVVKLTGDEMREEASVEDKKKKKKMLIGGQAKLDKNKNNRIDSEDFELLRAGKKRGGVMKAKRGRLAGQDFSERMKNVERGLIDKKTGKPVSMDAMRQLKGFKTGELPKEFNKRRMALAGTKEALKRTKIGKIALGVAGVGLAAKALLDKKRKEAKEKKQNKKMGGGMMKTPGYKKGKGVMIMVAVGKPKKKMGGGMMKPQKAVLGLLFRKKRRKATPGMKMVESSPGGFGLLGRLAKKVGLQKGGGADTGRMGEIKSRLAVATQKLGKLPGRRLTSKDLERLKKLKPMKPLSRDTGGPSYSTRTPPNVFFDADGRPGKETFLKKQKPFRPDPYQKQDPAKRPGRKKKQFRPRPSARPLPPPPKRPSKPQYISRATGGDTKIKKVIKGLNKASALHKGQAKTLGTLVNKKAVGGMADYYKDLM